LLPDALPEHAATVISHFPSHLFPCNRERNRSHAKKSRQRKKVLTVLLQESAEELKSENQKLREEVNAFIGQKKAEAIMTQMRERNRDQFLTALMDPQNRVLNTSGMAFMKKLRKRVPRD
jgi:DNA repair protein RadC